VREGVDGCGGTVLGGGGTCVGGGGVKVNVGTAVEVAGMVGGTSTPGVKDGMTVSPAVDGWNGVGVGEAFGSCVTRMKVGNCGGGIVAGAQAVRIVKSKRKGAFRNAPFRYGLLRNLL